MPNLEAILQLWDRVRTSLWFIPGLMAVAALILAGLTPALDRVVPDEWLLDLPVVYSGEPSGARAVLSTVAMSMITTAGVVFSMTIVSLQLASSQFGPRLLRTFLRDRGNQVVLGAFVGIFLYCILVLPTVDASAAEMFVPHIAITIAVLLAIIGLGMLVYFIDHVAQSIHADAVIRSVAVELEAVLENLFPEPLGVADSDIDEDESPPRMSEAARSLRSTASGYVRYVNGDAMMESATEHDLLVRLEVLPGEYVFQGDVLASAWPAAEPADDACDESIREAFVLGVHRTPLQDPAFAFEQLAEMAVRALSPGINDPTTAVHCIDRIGSGLARLVGRRLPSRLRRDGDGTVRVVVDPIPLDVILEGAFDPIVRSAGAHLPVVLRLLGILEKVHRRAGRPRDRRIIAARAACVAESARNTFSFEHERRRFTSAAAWIDGAS